MENQDALQVNLYEHIETIESEENTSVNIKDALLSLVDQWLQKKELTDAQRNELGRFRSRIVIELQSF